MKNKWQKALNNKSDEEIERINKAKMNNGKSYSGISQNLFWVLYNNVKKDFDNIYFAELNQKNENDNMEYMIKRSDGKVAFLDFYIKDVNKAIEFDGDYWHGEKRGNQERDRIREEKIFDSDPNIQILHIKERDYKNNPEETIKRCIDFIYA